MYDKVLKTSWTFKNSVLQVYIYRCISRTLCTPGVRHIKLLQILIKKSRLRTINILFLGNHQELRVWLLKLITFFLFSAAFIILKRFDIAYTQCTRCTQYAPAMYSCINVIIIILCWEAIRMKTHSEHFTIESMNLQSFYPFIDICLLFMIDCLLGLNINRFLDSTSVC